MIAIISYIFLLLAFFLAGIFVGVWYFSKRNNIETIHSNYICNYCENNPGNFKKCERFIFIYREYPETLGRLKCFSGRKLSPYVNVTKEIIENGD